MPADAYEGSVQKLLRVELKDEMRVGYVSKVRDVYSSISTSPASMASMTS